MKIGDAAIQSIKGGSPSKRNDSSSEIQKLEQQKENIKQQLRQLEQSKKGGDGIKNAKEKLQKQIKEIEQQIQVLRQQSTEEVQPTEDGTKADKKRFDGYVKNDKEASETGIYKVGQDEDGNPVIIPDRPEKPSRKSSEPAKPPTKGEKPEIMKGTVNTDKVDAEIRKLTEQRQDIRQELKQAGSSEEKAAVQKQLANIETELRLKDSDAYRKQNAAYTYGKES